MNKQELEAFAKQAAKGIKSEADLNDFRAMLTKVTVEVVLRDESQMRARIGGYYQAVYVERNVDMQSTYSNTYILFIHALTCHYYFIISDVKSVT